MSAVLSSGLPSEMRLQSVKGGNGRPTSMPNPRMRSRKSVADRPVRTNTKLPWESLHSMPSSRQTAVTRCRSAITLSRVRATNSRSPRLAVAATTPGMLGLTSSSERMRSMVSGRPMA